jgi:hypothetical protein
VCFEIFLSILTRSFNLCMYLLLSSQKGDTVPNLSNDGKDSLNNVISNLNAKIQPTRWSSQHCSLACGNVLTALAVTAGSRPKACKNAGAATHLLPLRYVSHWLPADGLLTSWQESYSDCLLSFNHRVLYKGSSASWPVADAMKEESIIVAGLRKSVSTWRKA